MERLHSSLRQRFGRYSLVLALMVVVSACYDFGVKLGVFQRPATMNDSNGELFPYESPALHVLGNLFVSDAFAQKGDSPKI